MIPKLYRCKYKFFKKYIFFYIFLRVGYDYKESLSCDTHIFSRTLFQELATNVKTALETLGRRLGLDLLNERELSIAGFGRWL